MKEYKEIYTKEQKDKFIKKELLRFKRAFNDLDEEKKISMQSLFYEAAFLSVTLREAREMLIRDGIVEVYRNSATQYGLKKSPVLQAYDKMLNTYSKIIAQLNKEIPIVEKANKDRQEILDFIAKKPMRA